MMGRVSIIVWCGVTVLAMRGCASSNPTPNRFDNMPTVDLQLKTQKVQAWIADEDAERTAGLMYVTPEELAPLSDGTERGMFFVFEYDRPAFDGFWMKNVPIPLDIAFIKSDGTIVSILTMAAYDENTYRPTGSYRYTLELNANTYSRLGMKEGDVISIPSSIVISSKSRNAG